MYYNFNILHCKMLKIENIYSIIIFLYFYKIFQYNFPIISIKNLQRCTYNNSN